MSNLKSLRDPGVKKIPGANAGIKFVKDVAGGLLTRRGFSFVKPAVALRRTLQRIDGIEIETFSEVQKENWGIPLASFSLALGTNFTFAPNFFRPSSRLLSDGSVFVSASECHLRVTPYKGVVQPECQKKNIWVVEESGAVRSDVLNALQRGVDLLDKWQSLEVVLTFLRNVDEVETANERIWGFGRSGSVVRHALTAFIADQLGVSDVAADSAAAALNNGGLSALSGADSADSQLQKLLSNR